MRVIGTPAMCFGTSPLRLRGEQQLVFVAAMQGQRKRLAFHEDFPQGLKPESLLNAVRHG